MRSDNLAVVRRLFDAVEHRDARVLTAVYAPDIVIREADSLPYGGVYHGHQGALQHAAGYLQTWHRMQSSRERNMLPRFLDAGEHVVVLWRQRARQIKTGATLDLPAVSVYRLHQQRIAESTMYHLDTAQLLRFLGMEA